jgi:Fe-S-cluster-containing dehydrogenase component
MAVFINDTCINCGACIDECPVEAIVDDGDNPTGEEFHYVYPDKCVECVDHHDTPACVESCPTDGCITWDMPFSGEHKDFFSGANYLNGNKYVTEGNDDKPFKEDVSIEDRQNRAEISE